MNKMNIDLGWLGKVVLEKCEPVETEEGFTVVADGYTESGIRVHAVVDEDQWWNVYPTIWNNAILLKL